MEFAFEEKTFSHLQPIADQWLRQEETADMIVPDSSPDAVAIVHSFATVSVRSVACIDGSLQISGGIQAGVLYLAQEESQPRLLETYLPFTVKKDWEGCDDESLPVVQCHLSGCSGRILNSRKLLLRMEICCGVQLYQRRSQTVYLPLESDPRLQLRRKVCPMALYLDVGQKLFTVEEELELPAGRPELERLLHTAVQTQITESRIAGARAVFKGLLNLQFLYLSVEGNLERWQLQLPFSQFCDLSDSYDDETLQVVPLLAGCEAVVEAENLISLSIMLNAQCIVCGEREFCLVDDAYYLGGSLQAQKASCSLRQVLDTHTVSQPVRLRIPGSLQSVQDVQVLLGRPEINRQAEAAQAELPVVVQLCGMDDAGNVSCLQSQERILLAQTAPPDSGCQIAVSISPEIYAIAGGAEVDVRFTVDGLLQWNSLCGFETIRAVSVQQTPQPARPAVILRRIAKDTPVWELAKNYQTTCQSICSVNDLREELVPAGTLLLMPLV